MLKLFDKFSGDFIFEWQNFQWHAREMYLKTDRNQRIGQFLTDRVPQDKRQRQRGRERDILKMNINERVRNKNDSFNAIDV